MCLGYQNKIVKEPMSIEQKAIPENHIFKAPVLHNNTLTAQPYMVPYYQIFQS